MPSFKEIYEADQLKKKKDDQPAAKSNAAATILLTHTVKDRRLTFRISSQLYNQFSAINKQICASNGSIVNMLIAQYVREHQDMLEPKG